MLRIVKLALAVFLFSLSALAQRTTVSATVADSHGTPYVLCSFSADFVGLASSGGPYTIGGSTFQTSVPGQRCDGFGNFTVQLPDNNAVQPTPSQWRFSVCSTTGYFPGNQLCFQTQITITGAAQNISAALTAAAPILPLGYPFPLTTKGDLFGYGGPGIGPLRVPVGADGNCLVANSASATGLTYGACGTGGGGGGGTPGGSPGQLQVNVANTTFGGVTNLNNGSALVSQGTGNPPAFQQKAIYDVRDWATCDSSTDSTSNGPRGGVKALLNTIGATEATIYWIGSTGAAAHCRLENTVFPANVSHDFSGGGAIEMISSTTTPGNAVFVNGTSAECNGGGGGLLCNTANATNGSTTLSITAGNTIVVSAAPYPGFTFKISTVTDDCGDIFYHVQQSLAGQPRNTGLWVGSNATGGTCTITANANGATTHIQVLVNQYSGMGPVVSPDGKGSCTNADTTTMTSGSASATAGSLLFSYGGQPFTSETCTAGAGFTQPAGLAGQSTSGFACSQYQLSAAGGSVTANQTITSPPTGSWVYCLQPLKVGNATATILGGITDPDLHQIFFNAQGTATTGAVDFTGNLVDFAVHPEWWGASPTNVSLTTNTAALQAATWAAFGNGPSAVRSNGSGLNIYNKVLALTGNYSINGELNWFDIINFHVDCRGRINNGITQTASNLRIINGQSVAYGDFYNCSWAGSAANTGPLLDIDFDGVTTLGDLKPQFIDFYNNSFLGNGVVSVGMQLAKSGGAAQGSNVYCYDCAAQSFTTAAWQIGTSVNAATNALAIGWFGGDIQGSPQYGIAAYGGGYIFEYGTTNENGFSSQTGYDMLVSIGQGPCIMDGVRSESRRLASCTTLDIKDSGTGDGQMQYPTPGASAAVGTVVGGDLNGVGWDGRYYKVSIDTNAFNGVGTPSATIFASSGTATSLTNTNQTVAGQNTIKTFVFNETVTQAVTGSTATLKNTFSSTATVTGSNGATPITLGETFTQSVTGVTATQIAPTPGINTSQSLFLNNLSGTADSTHTWVGGTSGAVYTPNAAPTFSTVSMLITAATGAPDGTHNWTGGTSGAVLVPSGAPVNVANYTANLFNGMLLTLLGGTGNGCKGVITSNTAQTINFTAGLTTNFFRLACPNPDSTTTYIVQPNWNNSTIVDDNTGGGCSPCMTLVPLNEDGIGGGTNSAFAQGVLDNVSVPGDQIKVNSALTVLRKVFTTRNDWLDATGTQAKQNQNPVEWDVTNVNAAPVGGARYYQSWSVPTNQTGGSFLGPFQRNLGQAALVWSCAPPGGGPECKDAWIGGRSDPNSQADATRTILEYGGMLGRASAFGTDQTGTDSDITGGPSTGAGNGGAINFWTSNPGASSATVNSGLKRWSVATGGNILAGADNTYNIGAVGASRPANVYVGNSVNAAAVNTSGLFGESSSYTEFACETSGAPTTLNVGGTTTDTGLNCLSAPAVIDAVVYRITTTITTAANFTIGDATTAARFCSTQSTLTAGTTGVCFVQADQTGAAGPRQTTAAKVRVTTNANPGAGAIRLLVFYHTWVPPTS